MEIIMYTLENLIEQLRSYLVEQAMIKGSLTDARVIQLSKNLDVFIVEYEKLKARNGMCRQLQT
jgi:hypothetical protein